MASSSSTSTSVSFSAFTSTPAIVTEKLVGSSNYVSGSKAVEKWCIGQGLKNHLYTEPEDVKDEKERENFERTDALLCTLLWQSIDPSLHNIYTNFDTCCELWTQAKSLYTNDIQCLYSVVDKLINLRQQGITISEFVGQMSSIKAEFNALLPAGKPIVEDLAQRDKFFMVCTLAALSTDLASVRDQILASPSIPNLDEVFSRLLRVTSVAPPSPVAPETSALVSTNVHHGPREEQGGDHRGGRGSSRPRCTYCHRWGHTKDKCFKLHGRPRVNLAHNDDTMPEQSMDSPVQQSITLTGIDYDDYLRYRASQQSSTSTASDAHSASFLDSHEVSDHSKAFIQDDDLQAPTQVSDSKSHVSQKGNNSAVPARPAFHFSPAMVQGKSTETKDLASGKSNVVQKFDLTSNSEIKSTPVMSLPQKSMISTYSTAETPLSLIKSSEMPITNSKMTMATSFTMGDKLSGAFTPESWRKNFPSSESHSSTISAASTVVGKVTEFNFDKSWPENNSPAVPEFSGSCESLSSPTNITPSVSSVSSSVSSAVVPPAAVSVTSSSSMTSSNTSIDSNYMSTSSASDFLCLSNQAPKQTSSSLPNPPSLNSTSESLKSESQPAAMPNLKTDLDAAAGVVTQLKEPLNGESELKLGSSRKFSPTNEQSSNTITSSKINAVSVSQSEQPSDAPLQLSTSFLASTSVSSAKNGGFDVGISQEDEMEEEAPETNNATELSLESLGGFGISSTPNPSMPKSDPFGGSFNNAATSLSSSSSSFSVPSGELFRPASFSFPSPQSSAPTQSTNSGAFFGGGFGVGAAVPPQAPSAFGQPAQIGSGQQVLGSVLGTFGQSRQLGSGLTGSGFAAPTGFGGGYAGSSSTSGFSNPAAIGGGFAGIASTGGGFGGIASTGGGFAGVASTGSGFSGFASPVGGFSGAASTGGGGFAAVSSTGGFAGAALGGAFGAHSNQGSGRFAAFGNVVGNKPPELFTQMRK